MNSPITVIKRDIQEREVWRYSGQILRKKATYLVLEARFNRPDMEIMGELLKRGDRLIETYYFDRWYNKFEIYDRDDDRLKGWYCNVCKPAAMEAPDVISYVDLALDLWVSSDGSQTIMDEDEFGALALDAQTRSMARSTLEELQSSFTKPE